MNIEQKIKQCMREASCSPSEACEMLGISLDASVMASLAIQESPVTLSEIIEGGKLSAARVLVDIIEDGRAENKDRIAAAKIILIGSGELPNIGVSAYEERFKKFAALVNINAENIIDVVDRSSHSSNRMLTVMAS